jgi:hypothetical protein
MPAACDQRHVLTCVGQQSADDTAYCTGPYDDPPHGRHV